MNKATLTRVDQMVVGWMRDVQTNVMKRVDQHMQVDRKSSPRDLVTNVDRETEQFYVSAIRRFDKTAKILGEEGFGDRVADMNGAVWFVDPIDGTMNFVKQHDEFASMVALYEDGQPQLAWIMDVANNVILHGGPAIGVFKDEVPLDNPADVSLADGLVIVSGARLLYEEYGFPEVAKAALGYRVYGSAGISFMHVLEGKSVAYSSHMKPWDFAAGVLLAQTLGLKVGTIDEDPVNMLLSGTVLVATEHAYDDIMAIERSL
jgi:myo-inositol-1(or 4)-monophosphatase